DGLAFRGLVFGLAELQAGGHIEGVIGSLPPGPVRG
ncbi:hypothetical protein A2U01_0119283, partial [Trifolium medium]|nr:hypothetical protein [Trifolium medium]